MPLAFQIILGLLGASLFGWCVGKTVAAKTERLLEEIRDALQERRHR